MKGHAAETIAKPKVPRSRYFSFTCSWSQTLSGSTWSAVLGCLCDLGDCVLFAEHFHDLLREHLPDGFIEYGAVDLLSFRVRDSQLCPFDFQQPFEVLQPSVGARSSDGDLADASSFSRIVTIELAENGPSLDRLFRRHISF